MQKNGPTYSIAEIKDRLPGLNTAELRILKALIDEEVACYPAAALAALRKYIWLLYKIQSRREQVTLLARLNAPLQNLWERLHK